MADEEKKRQILEISHVEKRQPIGDKGAVKLGFTAIDKVAGQQLKLCTFKKSLFETIEGAVGKSLECEYLITHREVDDIIYTDRKVEQVFVNGQPVATDKGYSGGRGSWNSKTPDQVAAERDSIEKQTAFKGVIDLMVGEVITLDNDLAVRAMAWAMDKLGGKEDKPPNKPEAPKAEVKPEPLKGKTKPPTHFEIADFMAWFNEQGVDQKGCLEILSKKAGHNCLKLNDWTAEHTLADAKKAIEEALAPKDVPVGGAK